MKKQPEIEYEWSFPVMAEDIGTTPARYQIKPDADQTAALTERFDLLGLKNVTGDLTLVRERGVVIHVTGKLSADVTQKCVATLEPVDAHVEDEFEAFFTDNTTAIPFVRARAEIKAKQGDAEVEMVDERDAPEAIEPDGTINLGELVAQYLSLALDPYPRSANAPKLPESVKNVEIGAAEEAKNNPFAALKEWKDTL